jgi:hypothetical protein
MSRLLVTVVGPAGPVDLVVPAEQPVSALLDPLAQAAGSAGEQGGAAGHRWSLAPVGGDSLPPGRSLAACGVGDGAVLALVDGSPPTVSPSRPRPSAVIGVLSAAAGMGRTTVAALVSGALAAGPGGPTVVVDAHPGAGSLSERLTAGDDVEAGDLLALIDHPALTREETLACLAWSRAGLALLATRPSRGRGQPLAQGGWTRLVRGLAAHGLTVVLDCGPGLGDPSARAALDTADQVLLVVESSPSPASRWMAYTIANRGLPVIAMPWPVRSRLDAPAPAPTSPAAPGFAPAGGFPAALGCVPGGGFRAAPGFASGGGFPAALGFASVSAAALEEARRVAEVLVADWTALGIMASSTRRPC